MKKLAVVISISFLTVLLYLDNLNASEPISSEDINVGFSAVQVELPNILKKDHPTFSNLLKNGSFESFQDTYPANWVISDTETIITQDNTNIRYGSYSLSISNSNSANLSQEVTDFTSLKGEKLSLGCWVKSTIPNQVKLTLNDGVSQFFSDYHSGSGEWEFLKVKTTIDDNAIQLTASIDIESADIAYIDGVCLYQLTKDIEFIANPQDDIKMPNNLIYTDLINKRMGINTNTPQEALEVEGNIKATGVILQGDNETLTQTSADSLYVNQTGDTMTGSLTLESANLNVNGNITADKFLLSDGTEVKSGLWTTKEGTSDIYYDSGKVGIGTSTPNNTLQVANLINFDNAKYSTFLGYEAGKINTGDYNTFIGYQAGTSNTTGNYNTFLGDFAGSSNTIGNSNTFLGYFAGSSNTTGNGNIFLGRYAGSSNTTGYGNTFLGYNAGSSNTTGTYNTFLGRNVGSSNTTGYYNTFLGDRAGTSNTTGNSNTFLGYYAGSSNTTGAYNTFLGQYAGDYNTTGNYNTFLGDRAGYSNTTGNSNTFLGDSAGYSNTTGTYNTFLGYSAGSSNTTGNNNTFLGRYVGFFNTEGSDNTFLGNSVGFFNTTGKDNTFLGRSAGSRNTTGNDNTFLGRYAGYSNTTGSGNVFIGVEAGYNESGSNKLYIANSNTTTPLIYGDFSSGKIGINTTELSETLNIAGNIKADKFLLSDGTEVKSSLWSQNGSDIYYDSGYVGIGTASPSYPLHMGSGAHVTSGGVWTNASSREYKENIRDLTYEEANAALTELRPTRFNYKVDKEERHLGFIAEEVPELVASKDRKGLSPMDIVAVLTKVVQYQQKEIEALKAQLNERR